MRLDESKLVLTAAALQEVQKAYSAATEELLVPEAPERRRANVVGFGAGVK